MKISKEHVSIFTLEEQAKYETRMKLLVSLLPASRRFYDPEDRGMFLRNVG
jgi:hypothetical protein